MKTRAGRVVVASVVGAILVALTGVAGAQQPTSYAPVALTEKFDVVKARMEAAKPEIMKRQMDLLEARYDLRDRPMEGVTSGRGKAVQDGVRVKLPSGATWEDLAGMTPEQIKSKGLWPKGFLPLPHPNHPEGGMVFPQFHIDEIIKQEGRDLTRFDLDLDLPDHFLPEYPPAIYLTTRTDLGDVSQGKVVTMMNYYELFNGILNPKQIEGLRLLVTPFPQQQFNQTEDRRSALPSRGVTCFDCHVATRTARRTSWAISVRRSFATAWISRRCGG